MGGGDWNDGMNRVGIEGKGESVWLAWFLIHVLNDYAELLQITGQHEAAAETLGQILPLAEAIEANAWDGAWYRRAYFDDGSPLGSNESPAGKIDCIAQSWAVISGAGNKERSLLALKSAEEFLVKYKDKLVLLLTPPFDKSAQDPGYIKGYPPGVRENGSQYTHGSLWLPLAFARLGDGKKAVSLLNLMLPINLSLNPHACQKYEVEPYVLAGDINYHEDYLGRGGWTWYSGSAGWMYRIWLEEILGFKLRGKKLKIDCTLPPDWEGFKILFQYLSTAYSITVENPERLSKGRANITHNGIKMASDEITLVDDGQKHEVLIVLRAIADAT